jgi:uncharacterized cupredoxin-like copper-binding protein
MLYGQVGTDAASGVILTADALEQIEAVKQNPKLTAQQKINQIGEIVRSAAIAGALTTLSLKGSKADLKQLKHGNIDVKPQTLEHKTHTDQQKHQVTVKQEVVEYKPQADKMQKQSASEKSDTATAREVGGDRNVIELEPGKKGSWNKALNKQLEPDSDYKIGNYTYQTNNEGTVSRVFGKLNLEKRDRNTYQQKKSAEVGGIKDGLQADDGGHLVASIFNGPGEQINYAPMNSNLNRGRWKRMENKWVDALKLNKEVRVDIRLIFEGSNKRPTAFSVKYWIDDKKKTAFFENKHGG